MYVMQLVDVPGNVRPVVPGDEVVSGDYLMSFDPDGMEGHGVAGWTPSLALARRFESAVEGLSLWREQSKVRPLRSDGKPNRPLSAYSILMVEVPDEPG